MLPLVDLNGAKWRVDVRTEQGKKGNLFAILKQQVMIDVYRFRFLK